MPLPPMTLWSVVLDSSDAQELASFYERLLGWQREQDEPGWVKLRCPDGPGLSFSSEPAYQRPSWPTQPPDQQMMIHLDIKVDDLERAIEHALAAGAVLAEFQPQEDVRVFFDPAGHPFCLFEH
jgi:catechol-2,3-dioxygenase